jgi:tricorn protease
MLLGIAAFSALGFSRSRTEGEPVRLLQEPTVANDGRLAFVFQQDIWIADRTGANVRRLTAHIGRDRAPSFSPDGRTIAFTSNRSGNNDVFLVSAAGGEPRQLTFHSGNDNVVGWTPQGDAVIIASARGTHPFGAPLYLAPIDGSIPTPLPIDFGSAGAIKQDGSVLAFNRGPVPPTNRRGYKGNNTADIFTVDLKSKLIRQLTDTNHREYQSHVHDGYPMWGADGNIYFLTERGGALPSGPRAPDSYFNIWRMDASGRNAQRVTDHKEPVQRPSISADGRIIVYECSFEICTVDVPGGQPKKIPISIATDVKTTQIVAVSSDGRADDFSPHPSGDYVAVDVHGEIAIVPAEAGIGEMTRVTNNTPWRERTQQYSPDGSKIAYISDESHEEEIWIYDVATAARRKLTTHESIKRSFMWSPNSAKLLVDADKRLFEIDVATGKSTELGRNEAGGFTVTDIAPDNQWIVYTRSNASQNAEVFLFDTRTRREINVTRNPYRDGSGLLTADGKHLVFTSARNAAVNHLFVVPLSAVTENPNDPLVRERQRSATGGAGRGTGGAGQNIPAFNLQIDETGIERRAVQLTQGTNAVGSVFLSRDGRTIYFTSTDTAGAGLFAIGVDGRERRRIATGAFAGLTPTPDRRFVFYRQGAGGGGRGGRGGAPAATGSEVYRMTLATPQRRDRVTVGFDIRIDQRGEWEQIFEEAWRSMKYRFYDAKMHGVDWNATKAKYKPLLKYAASNEDVHELAMQVIAELNASHTGVSGPASVTIPGGENTRYLGFEMEPAQGRYRITHIYRNGPADKEWLKLKVGDYVLALAGTELKAGDNYWKTLNATTNVFVPVRVAKSPAGDSVRVVRIETVASLNNIKYEEWVENNRDFVAKESKGQVAYVHIRAMDEPSLVRFQSEIDRFWDVPSIVVDVRYNGGGNIDEQLIDILERRPYNHVNQRAGDRTWGRRPRQAIAGPKVMLINQRSFSDAEATPQAFKTLGLGRLVGTPTGGGVIWTGSYTLIHGGTIRTPGSLAVTWDPTKPNNYGLNLENYGVPPDVWVRNTPEDEMKGFDRELKAAVDEALRMLKDGKWVFQN